MIRSTSFLKRIIAAMIIPAAVSCSDDKTNLGIGAGTIDVTIEIDNSVSLPSGTSTPSAAISKPDLTDFDLIITDSEGNSSSWTGVTSMGAPERLLPGFYTVRAVSGSIGAEGFDCPCFAGEATVMVENARTIPVNIVATISNTLVDVVFDQSVTELFGTVEAIVHSGNGMYHTYKPTDSGPLFLCPGNLSVMLSINDGTEQIDFSILSVSSAQPSTFYRVSIEATEGADGVASIKASCSNGEENTVKLTPEFLAETGPTIDAPGFHSGTTISINEGGTADSPLIASVSSSSLDHLYLTALAPTLGSAFSREIDLVNLSPQQKDSLTNYRISVEGIHKGEVVEGTVDLSKVVSFLRYVEGAIPSKFALLAVDKSGRTSQPATLSVEVLPVELTLESVSKSIIGVNKAQIVLASSSSSLKDNIMVQAYDFTSDKWTDLKIDTLETAGPSRWAVTFTVPEGRDDVTCRLLFCGNETNNFIITRTAPQYSVEADPFSLHVNLRIKANDPEMTGVITSTVQFYKIGKDKNSLELMQMIERHPSDGMVTVSGLDASTTYRVCSSLLANPESLSEDFTEPIEFRTEASSQIPNGDFEDVKYSSIKYSNMLSGGRYSQNTVEIYNLQNRTSFDLMTPEKWATVNDKTFCRSATNHNTWYLAPSTYTVNDAYSGAYAVRLDCVGYDIHGQKIPDYLQPGPPYTLYSCNIPAGFSHAAGRLFLGSYSFDPENLQERYVEGLAFSSRPVAVNGFYKFVATSANPRATALARVEVIGNLNGADIVIAENELHLPVALSYTAFTIPLSYERFGMKATSIRLMFAPSDAIGDIESETQSIIVLPDPATSTSRGSSLWLDNLSLSY